MFHLGPCCGLRSVADGANPHAFWERELGPEVASLVLFFGEVSWLQQPLPIAT